MSSELGKALLRRYQPEVIAQRAQSILSNEIAKGCQSDIAPAPVILEPPFLSLRSEIPPITEHAPLGWTLARPGDSSHWQRMQVWISPEQPCDWMRSERFLRQVSWANHRIGLELVGNKDRVDQLLFFHRDDAPLIAAAFTGEFERCALTPAQRFASRIIPATPRGFQFREFYPSPPYTRLLTRPAGLGGSIYGTVVSALGGLSTDAFGLFQVLFEAAPRNHDWHYNVKRLIDMEYEFRQVVAWAVTHANAHQPPTGYIAHMSDEAYAKAHNDMPLFFAAVRVAVFGEELCRKGDLDALCAFAGMVQHGGRPLCCLDDEAYRCALPGSPYATMLAHGQTFRPGFLVNSEELTTLAHFSAPAVTQYRCQPLAPLEPLGPSSDLAAGLQIGICQRAGHDLPVCLPLNVRTKHMHVIGRPGTGKSSMLENMILQEILLGHGVAVVDPHGPLIDRLLRLIPEDQVHRVLYINPADRQYVPIWNPLRCGADHDLGRVTTDLLSALQSIAEVRGNRLAHLLRHAIFALLHLPGSSLRDVNDLLRKGSPSSEQLIRFITGGAVTNDLALRFWKEDFQNYGKDEIRPPQHVLGKLLVGGTSALMLSQPDSAFDLRTVMDEGEILLLDLSDLGAETRNTLGCFLLSLLHETAITRRHAPRECLRPFHIYCDEAHRFMTEAVDDLIAETRKFSVSLTLAHQFMRQFGSRAAGALSSVASTVIFNVDREDATYLKKDLLGRVDEDDLIIQGTGQAIARISTNRQVEIVRVKTSPPRSLPESNHRQAIIARCRQRYYKPVDEVIRIIKERNHPGERRFDPPVASLTPPPEPEYDEL